MIDPTRELIAYLIIGAILIIGAPLAIVGLRKRRRAKLRRRGNKRHGH